MQAEQDRKVRDAIRERQLEYNANAHYDIFNGKPRRSVDIPDQNQYNPSFSNANNHVDLAGKPTRNNSNQQFVLPGTPEKGKRQYSKNMTVGKTIPYNDAPIMISSSIKQAPIPTEPSLYGHAG